DDDVEGAELGACLLEHLRDLTLVRYVGPHRDGGAAELLNLVGNGMCVLVTDVIDGDGGTGFGHRDGDRLADPRIGAGDERLLAISGIAVMSCRRTILVSLMSIFPSASICRRGSNQARSPEYRSAIVSMCRVYGGKRGGK